MSKEELFRFIGKTGKDINQPCYIVGGYVRDTLLGQQSDDYDFVTIGSGTKLAEELGKRAGVDYELFPNYGTAKLTIDGNQIEIVGARKETYQRGSRNPIVEDGTLEDDLRRRDFTINAMAISVMEDSFGELIDLFGGMSDLKRRILRTPQDPDTTFSDDPLRMLRCIRFAARLGFDIAPPTWTSIIKCGDQVKILSKERISVELYKILQSLDPGRGIMLLHKSKLLPYILPELSALSLGPDEEGHKDNLLHSITVLTQLAEKSDNVWLRFAALLHDIGKAATKRWDETERTWTFYDHEHIGAEMIPTIFRRLSLPMGREMRYVQKMVKLHMRPGLIPCDEVSDSAIRRLISDCGDEDIDDLLLLGDSDISSKYQENHIRLHEHYRKLRAIIEDLRARDAIRLFQPVLSGNDIMEIFGLDPGRLVGEIKRFLKDAVLDGQVENSKDKLIDYVKNYFGDTIGDNHPM